MSIMDLLNRVVGVTDYRQSIAWIGTVGIAIGVSVATYLRVGQTQKTDNELRKKVDVLFVENADRVNPVDVREEVYKLQKQLNDVSVDYQTRLDDLKFEIKTTRESIFKANPDLTPP